MKICISLIVTTCMFYLYVSLCIHLTSSKGFWIFLIPISFLYFYLKVFSVWFTHHPWTLTVQDLFKIVKFIILLIYFWVVIQYMIGSKFVFRERRIHHLIFWTHRRCKFWFLNDANLCLILVNAGLFVWNIFVFSCWSSSRKTW